MRKKGFKILMLGLMLVLPITEIALAESISFSVSCTIPAIPGLNAPPFPEEETVKADTPTPVQEETKTQKEEPKTESPSMIEEDTEEGNKLVKTIYSR